MELGGRIRLKLTGSSRLTQESLLSPALSLQPDLGCHFPVNSIGQAMSSCFSWALVF